MGVLALDQNTGEVHRDSTRQEQGQQGQVPIDHSTDPEKALKLSRTWSQGREEGSPCWRERDPETVSSNQESRRQHEKTVRMSLDLCSRDLLMKQLYREQRYQNVTSLSCKWDMGYWFPLMAWGSLWFTLRRTYGFNQFFKSPAWKVSHRYLQPNERGK